MIEEWITFSKLCERWKINAYTLAKLVIDGKLRSHNKDFLEICVTNDGYFIDSPDGHGTLIHESLTVDEVAEHIFRISHVEEKEKAEFSAGFDEAIERSPIIDEIRWLESQKPRDINEMANKDNLLNDRYAKLVKIDGDKTGDDREKTVDPSEAAKPLPQNPEPVNFFILKGHFWQVGYEGEVKTVHDLDGMHYITLLIEKPGTSISCRKLYQAASGKTPDKIMNECAAINEGLNIGSGTQSISDPKAKNDYFIKYQNLQNDLEKAESEIERQEIEQEIDTIIPFLKERSFPNKDTKKIQSNLKRRLDKAYEAIHKEGLKNLAKHLRVHVKPDNAYGLIYTGSLTWHITR